MIEMMPLLPVILSLLMAYGVAAIGGRWLLAKTRATLPASLLILLCVVCSPLLVPVENRPGRMLTAFLATDLLLRIVDCTRQVWTGRSRQLTWRRYLIFLVPFPIFAVTLRQQVAWGSFRGPRSLEFLRMVVGGCIFAGMFLLLRSLHLNPMLRQDLLLDHVVTVGILVVAIEAASQGLCGLERSLGFATAPLVKWIMLSRSPADFWVRWNYRVREWLVAHAFRPVGGLRRPVRGVVATFAISAVVHELMFDVATQMVTGYQLLFFLLQIPAVLISPTLERLADRYGLAGEACIRGVSVAWMVATSALFLHGVHQLIPFLYSRPPASP